MLTCGHPADMYPRSLGNQGEHLLQHQGNLYFSGWIDQSYTQWPRWLKLQALDLLKCILRSWETYELHGRNLLRDCPQEINHIQHGDDFAWNLLSIIRIWHLQLYFAINWPSGTLKQSLFYWLQIQHWPCWASVKYAWSERKSQNINFLGSEGSGQVRVSLEWEWKVVEWIEGRNRG